jgi:putative transposase
VCRMLNEARARQDLPKRLSTDHDPLFRFHRWRANLRILEIEELKSVPFVPRSHPFVEQLIGTVRREYLDQVFFWSDVDLRRKLCRFAAYYNQRRVWVVASLPSAATVFMTSVMLGPDCEYVRV